MTNNGIVVDELDELESIDNCEKPPFEAFLDEEGRYMFRTSGGVIIELQAVPPSKSKRFYHAYRISHPQPTPPQHEIKRARKMVWVDNTNDPYFKQQMDSWNIDFSLAVSDYMIKRGVLSTPPNDFEIDSDILEMYGEVSEDQRKIIWVEGLLVSEEENEGFFEALRSITEATEGAIEESTTRFPSTR